MVGCHVQQLPIWSVPGGGLHLQRLYDEHGGRELLADQPGPLWEIAMYNPVSSSRVFLRADQDWSGVRFNASDQPEGISVCWQESEDSRFVGIMVQATVVSEVADGALRWDLQVTNDSEWAVYEVAFPQVNLHKRDSDVLFLPKQEGSVMRNIGADFHYTEAYLAASRASLQYMALYAPSVSGLYMGRHDPGPSVKNLRAETVSEAFALGLVFSRRPRI